MPILRARRQPPTYQGKSTSQPSRGQRAGQHLDHGQAHCELQAASKRFRCTKVLTDVTLRVRRGEMVVISGPSGSGKSTLLALLSGMERPSSGKAFAPKRCERAFIFQDYNLLETLNAKDNALLSARLLHRKVSSKSVVRTFNDLGLQGLTHRMPHELSGGQQQRIAIARALLARTPFVFADEPTGALDPHSASIVAEQLAELAARGTAVVVVTHDPLAFAHADRHLIMDQGRVRAL